MLKLQNTAGCGEKDRDQIVPRYPVPISVVRGSARLIVEEEHINVSSSGIPEYENDRQLAEVTLDAEFFGRIAPADFLPLQPGCRCNRGLERDTLHHSVRILGSGASYQRQ